MTEAAGPAFTPTYEPWRHGGWYVTNVRYPSGAVGCVSRNYPDRKWRIVCDKRPGSFPGGPGDHTYPSRDAAARAERELARDVLTLTATLTATLAGPGAMCSGHRDEIPAITVTDGVPYIPAYADGDGWLWCLACARHMSTCTDAGCGHPRAVFADAVPA